MGSVKKTGGMSGAMGVLVKSDALQVRFHAVLVVDAGRGTSLEGAVDGVQLVLSAVAHLAAPVAHTLTAEGRGERLLDNE